jgi:PHD/YefM family antitoxin component YafN of YafNO toxin-antitoxin module
MGQQISSITIRDVQRNYRKISEDLKKTDKPFVVMSKNEPQFVMVSLNAFEKYQKVTIKNSAQGLLNLATWAEQVHTKGPKDLSQNLDRYLWDK